MPVGTPLVDRPGRPEAEQVDTARHHGDPGGVTTEADQLGPLVLGRRHDPVRLARQAALHAGASRRAGVGRALVTSLHHAQRVVRVEHRDAERASGLERSEPRHPEVRVHDVGPLARPRPGEVIGERRHVRQELVLGQRGGGPGVDVVDPDPLCEAHSPWERRVVPPGVDHDVGAQPPERPCQICDVDVLPAGVDPAEHGEGAGVLGDHVDPHRCTSAFDGAVAVPTRVRAPGPGCSATSRSSRTSQSARKRANP